MGISKWKTKVLICKLAMTKRLKHIKTDVSILTRLPLTADAAQQEASRRAGVNPGGYCTVCKRGLNTINHSMLRRGRVRPVPAAPKLVPCGVGLVACRRDEPRQHDQPGGGSWSGTITILVTTAPAGRCPCLLSPSPLPLAHRARAADQ